MPQEEEYEIVDEENDVVDIEDNLTIEDKIKNLSSEDKEELKLQLISMHLKRIKWMMP